MMISLLEAHTIAPSERRAMKITLVQDFLRSGGTERQTILLANAFATAGHSVSLITFRPGGALAGTVAPQVLRRTLQPIDLHLDWFAPGLGRTLRTAAPDVVLCMGRMANCYAARIQNDLPAAAVVASMRTGKRLPRRYREGLLHARHVVANSRDARSTLIERYRVPAPKISVIHNSLVFPPAPPTPAEPRGSDGPTPAARAALRATHGAGPATTVLLCVAMFRPEKNQRELIEIAATMPAGVDWQLWLAGDGAARATCEELVAARGLGARVRFVGFQRDPSSLYAAADVAVHASWSEALSNFLIEAQAHGLPAVAYQAQGIEECFVPGDTGWAIARDDRGAFHAALLRLIALPSAARVELAARASAYAREQFDAAANVRRYLNLFSRLIARRSPGTDQA
jgi:glycosyltransferase involved in cell wall biosynthesis